MKLVELAEIIEKYPDVKTLAEEIKAAEFRYNYGKCVNELDRISGNMPQEAWIQ